MMMLEKKMKCGVDHGRIQYYGRIGARKMGDGGDGTVCLGE